MRIATFYDHAASIYMHQSIDHYEKIISDKLKGINCFIVEQK